MKSAEEMMEILEAFDLVGTLRGAAVLAGCDHTTVATVVRLRDEAAGGPERGSGPGRRSIRSLGRSRSGCCARADGSALIGRMSGWC